VIILDTHALIRAAIEPHKLPARVRRALEAEPEAAACDIILWEIAMPIARGRVRQIADPVQFINDIVQSRGLRLLPITPEIAVLSQSKFFLHGDPADRLIAATAIVHNATLITADAQLRKIRELNTLWK
jgi:PIN domain nuclease of toxin-antitoxin system